MADILSSPCWMKASDYAMPQFQNAYNLFADTLDQFGGPFMRHQMHITADDFYVAPVDAAEVPVASPARTSDLPASEKGEDRGFAYLLAVPFTVSETVCDVADDGTLCMADGATTVLVDMITSFHIMLASFPAKYGHVSLSIQANHITPLRCGCTYLALSRVDKMGRRIVYTSVDFVEPQLQPVHDSTSAPMPMTTAELLAAVKSATVLANVKHVKSMLSVSF